MTEHSDAYNYFIHLLDCTGSERAHNDFDPNLLDKVYDWEREEVEKIIWTMTLAPPARNASQKPGLHVESLPLRIPRPAKTVGAAQIAAIPLPWSLNFTI